MHSEDETNFQDEQDDSTNFPNKSSLVLNALISCLEDENQLVQVIF